MCIVKAGMGHVWYSKHGSDRRVAGKCCSRDTLATGMMYDVGCCNHRAMVSHVTDIQTEVVRRARIVHSMDERKQGHRHTCVEVVFEEVEIDVAQQQFANARYI